MNVRTAYLQRGEVKNISVRKFTKRKIEGLIGFIYWSKKKRNGQFRKKMLQDVSGKEYFEDMYNVDIKEQATISMCSIGCARQDNYFWDSVSRTEVKGEKEERLCGGSW